MEKVKCPFCGFTAHFVSSDGVVKTYVCEHPNCKKVVKIK